MPNSSEDLPIGPQQKSEALVSNPEIAGEGEVVEGIQVSTSKEVRNALEVVKFDYHGREQICDVVDCGEGIYRLEMPDAIPQTLPSALAAWLRRHKDMQVISATQLVDVRRIRIHTDCVTSDDKPTLLVITKR